MIIYHFILPIILKISNLYQDIGLSFQIYP